MHEAELVLSYPDIIANAIARALAPEARGELPKARAVVELRDGAIRIAIVADDLASLRAAVNSYARWVDAAGRAAGVGART